MGLFIKGEVVVVPFPFSDLSDSAQQEVTYWFSLASLYGTAEEVPDMRI